MWNSCVNASLSREIVSCRKEKLVRNIVIYGSRCNCTLSKTCKIGLDYCRKEDGRYKRGYFKSEWYCNVHIVRIHTGYVSAPAESVYDSAAVITLYKAVISEEDFSDSFSA